MLLLLVLAATLVGCERGSREGARSLSVQEFVDVMVALREAERVAIRTDSADEAFGSRRAEILESHGVVEEDLRAFVRRHELDLGTMRRVWETVNRRLRHLPDTAAAAPPMIEDGP